MKLKNFSVTLGLAMVLPLAGAVSMENAQAADQDRTRDKTQDMTRDQDHIYGSQLMTQQERNEHRAKMREAKTAEERERIRAEHHKQMQERARERGITLPDEPPAMPSHRGMGSGGGMGGGMGSGGGGGRR